MSILLQHFNAILLCDGTNDALELWSFE